MRGGKPSTTKWNFSHMHRECGGMRIREGVRGWVEGQWRD